MNLCRRAIFAIQYFFLKNHHCMIMIHLPTHQLITVISSCSWHRLIYSLDFNRLSWTRFVSSLILNRLIRLVNLDYDLIYLVSFHGSIFYLTPNHYSPPDHFLLRHVLFCISNHFDLQIRLLSTRLYLGLLTNLLSFYKTHRFPRLRHDG